MVNIPRGPLAGAVTLPAAVAVGTGVGSAIGGAIEPRVQHIKNYAWSHNQVMPPGAYILALGVAQGQIPHQWAADRAAEQGFSEIAFDHLVDAANVGPGVASAFELWRRDLIGDDAFGRALKRDGLEDEWIGPMRALKRELLSPAELANAVVQGHRSQDAAAVDAEKQGYNRTDFDVMVENTGLPPGPETLLAWWRRGIIGSDEFDDGIREGHIKTKYIDEYHDAYNPVLSAVEYAGLWLRGHQTEAQAKAGGALTGYTGPQMDLLYQNRGRPATVRQVHIGYARGGTLPGAANERAAVSASVKQSNIRPEYEGLLWEGRFTYPSAFVIRGLAQKGTFDRDQTEQNLVESGWKPEWAALAADDWAQVTTAGPGTKWADRARSRVFSDAWSDYMDGNADEAEFRGLLTAVGATAGERDTIVTLANADRGRTRRDLTQAQVLKLYRKAIWPREQAQAALEDLGMDAGDASDLLDSVGA